MGMIGGTFGYKILKRISQNGDNRSMDGSAYIGKSKLAAILGQNIWNEIVDKVVIDFGCGEGSEVIEIARHGARKVIGLDIQEKFLEVGRERAVKEGLEGKCIFALETNEKADVITAIDSFEHFDEPSSILETMSRLLKPSGCVLVAFGPTWYHPLGGHLFSVFPWAHLIFTEKALIRWRSDFKTDSAASFREVDGGLNQMTIARFEKIVESSLFRFSEFETVPIRKLEAFSNRLTREFTTAIVRCKLVLR
ncbi:MAG: class I SAM-dependent methyltransferase [Candidatus Methylumidiphilus sp.]